MENSNFLGKKFVLLRTIEGLKEGLSPAKISKKYNIPKTTIQYYIDGLRKKGYIKKVDYGTWEIIKEIPKEVRKHHHYTIGEKPQKRGVVKNKKKQIRGHAFIWKIRFFPKNIDWIRRLERYQIPYKLISNNKVARIIFKNRKIWLSAKGMTIYEPIDYLGSSSFETKGRAVFEMDQIIKDLGRKLQINLSNYKFTTSREHYGIIKNELAKQYNDKGEKLYIKSKDGDLWLWIDNSHSLQEIENNEVKINRKIQEWYNDHKKHNFEVTPTFVLNQFSENNRQLLAYAEQNKEHLALIQEYRKESVQNRKFMNKMLKAVKDLKK